MVFNITVRLEKRLERPNRSMVELKIGIQDAQQAHGRARRRGRNSVRKMSDLSNHRAGAYGPSLQVNSLQLSKPR